MTRRPVPPRPLGREPPLDLVVVQDLVPLDVEREHLAWSEATLFNNAVVVELDGSDFRSRDDQPFCGYFVAARSQAVAVEGGADEAAIGKR